MTPRKMVALSENGNVAGIADQWNAGAGWLYFMPWYDYENDWTSRFAHQHATISWWNAAFASENVVGLSGLPDDLYEK